MHSLELHSLSVCDLLRKMVLARAWSEGFDSRASSGTQKERHNFNNCHFIAMGLGLL